jgi:hypothetical protein
MARRSLIPIDPGMRFGRLTVIERAGSDRWGKPRFKCECDCGKITQPLAKSLRRGASKSCGCLRKEIASKHNAKDITGQRFGRLVALYQTGERGKDRGVVWRVRCDCGCEFEATTKYLGSIKSCGCLKREITSQIHYRHGNTIGGNSPLYGLWQAIKQRCYNPKNKAYKYYGERGITMALEWIDFIPFRDYINQALGPKPSPKHTLDRIENSEGYYPGNLKWSTQTEQNHNSGRSKIDKVLNTILREYANKPARRRRHVARI